MSFSGPLRRDGRTRSWSHEALVSLPARTSSPGIELFRRALFALALVALVVSLV